MSESGFEASSNLCKDCNFCACAAFLTLSASSLRCFKLREISNEEGIPTHLYFQPSNSSADYVDRAASGDDNGKTYCKETVHVADLAANYSCVIRLHTVACNRVVCDCHAQDYGLCCHDRRQVKCTKKGAKLKNFKSSAFSNYDAGSDTHRLPWLTAITVYSLLGWSGSLLGHPVRYSRSELALAAWPSNIEHASYCHGNSAWRMGYACRFAGQSRILRVCCLQFVPQESVHIYLPLSNDEVKGWTLMWPRYPNNGQTFSPMQCTSNHCLLL